MSTSNLVDSSILIAILVYQNCNEGDDPVGLQVFENLGWHDGLGHSGGSCRELERGFSDVTRGHTNWGNNVRVDVIFSTFLRQGLRKTHHGQLSSRVIALSKRTKETRCRRCIDNPSILLFSEMGPSSSSTFVRSLDMDGHNQIPVFVRHVLEGDVSQDTSIIKQDIDAAVVLDGRLDDAVAVLDAVVVGYRFAACGLDLVDDDICGLEMSDSNCINH